MPTPLPPGKPPGANPPRKPPPRTTPPRKPPRPPPPRHAISVAWLVAALVNAAPDIAGAAKDELMVPIAIAPATPIVAAHCLKDVMFILRGCRDSNDALTRAPSAPRRRQSSRQQGWRAM